MSELISLSLAEQLAGLRKREFTAVELADAHLAAMGQAGALNAVVLDTPELARTMAALSDAGLTRGEGGPLAGIPLGIKDSFCTEGVHTTAC